eukprot:gnl/TRDRNA2_/TRDRNA2_35688_c0_seq1.p1 gnl/TRDRNA2_/TRDRNA2_35688_c0~~gnl/TRDRNA2_/TRDRNA2_35688_c0_seq1.p1  ORF type:complete len:736 (-),score=165.72 gnl/TRDRNA2_/TRDRNA2_35688_c0_seq1:187-2394(-)
MAAPPAMPVEDPQAAKSGSTSTPSDDVAKVPPSGSVDTDGVAPAGTLSFREHLADQFEVIWCQRSEHSLRVLERLAESLKKRAQVERAYADGLAACAEQVQVDPQDGSVHESVDAVMINLRNRGEQSIELADEVEFDIVLMFEEVVKQHKEVSKRISSDVQVLQKHVKDTREEHDQLSASYFTTCTEAEQVCNELIYNSTLKPAERIKLSSRALSLSKQARSAEHQYLQSIEKVNAARSLFDRQMPTILDTLQEMEDKRSKCIKDGLRKLAVYEASWLRNLQYDLESTASSAINADPERDLQEFIRRQQGQSTPAAEAETVLEAKHFWELSSIAEAVERPVDKAKKWIEEKRDTLAEKAAEALPTGDTSGGKASSDQVEELRPTIRSLLARDASVATVDMLASRLDSVHESLEESRGRCVFVQAMRLEAAHWVDQLDSATREKEEAANGGGVIPIQISPSTFDTIVSLWTTALDACEDQNDAFCAKDLMILGNYLRSIDNEKPTSVFGHIYSHSLWSKVSIWEEMLYIGICEAYAAQTLDRRNLAAGTEFVCVAMTSYLQFFVRYMMSFGIKIEQCRSCVRRTLQRNASLLGVPVDIYAGLLLECAKEEMSSSPAAVQPSAANTPRTMADNGSTASGNSTAVSSGVSAGGGDGGSDTGSLSDKGGRDQLAAEDPFEAMAFGLQADGQPSEPGSASVSSTPRSEEAGVAGHGENAESEDKAVEALVKKRVTDDVFA